MSAEENKDLVRRFFEARVKSDLGTLDKMLAPDFVSHTKIFPGQQPGREGYIQAFAEHSAAMSNRRLLIEEQVAERDLVVTRYSVHVTHDRGTLLGMEPTGREWKLTHVDIHRILGGNIVEAWSASGAGPILEVLAQQIRARRAGA
jgi:predicted ester cyclase